MIRTLLFIAGLTASCFCQAETSINFSGNQVRVTVQGNPGDMDAPKLFDVMKVSSTADGTQNQKQLSFKNKSGQTVFELVCATSQNVANFGSCTFHLIQQPNMTFDPSHQKFVLTIQDPTDLANVTKLFDTPDVEDVIYSSADGKLAITLTNGTSKSFTVLYN